MTDPLTTACVVFMGKICLVRYYVAYSERNRKRRVRLWLMM